MYGRRHVIKDVRDCMSFATASGTISENCGIVSVQHAVQESFCGGFVNIILICIVVEYSVEDKCLVLDPFALRTNSGS